MGDRALGRAYQDGEAVVRQGEVGDCMFTIQEGRLEVVIENEGGSALQLRVMEKGAIFGEMAIFEHEVRSATVRALGPARVLTIDKRTFLRRIQEDPSLAFNLVRMMSQRIRDLTAQITELRHESEARPRSAPSEPEGRSS